MTFNWLDAFVGGVTVQADAVTLARKDTLKIETPILASIDGEVIDVTLAHIVPFGTSPTSWQSLDAGAFFANAPTEPTANPAGGCFVWGQDGGVKARAPGGAITSVVPTGTAGGYSLVESVHEVSSAGTATVDLASYTMVDGETIQVESIVLGRCENTDDSGSYRHLTTYECTGSTAAFVAQSTDHNAEQDSSWAVTVASSGTVFTIKVTAGTGDAVDWVCHMRVHSFKA